MKATTLLEQQHKKVKAMFKKLESGRSDPLPILQDLANDLVAHMAIEHEILTRLVEAIDRSLVARELRRALPRGAGARRSLAPTPKTRASRRA